MLKYLTTAVLNCIRNLLEEHLTRQLTDDLGEAGALGSSWLSLVCVDCDSGHGLRRDSRFDPPTRANLQSRAPTTSLPWHVQAALGS